MHLYESTWNLPDGLRVPYTCRCGAVYEIWSTKWSSRNPDKLACEECAALIIKWDGGRIWSAKLVRKRGAAGVPPV